MSGAEGLDDVWDDWQKAVNMTAKQLEDWLETDESQEVGQKDGGGESVGHASGRRIVEILRAKDDRFLGPFTLAQLTSVVLIAIGSWLLRSFGTRRSV